MDSFIYRFCCRFDFGGIFPHRAHLLCLRLVRIRAIKFFEFKLIQQMNSIFSKFVDSNAMAWIYMVSSSSLSAWLLHFLLLVLCMLPDVLVAMAETKVIRNGIVDSQV